MELLGKIRRMQVRDKMSERAIAKRTGLSRNTVRKWLEAPEEVEVPKYMRTKKFGKLTALTAELEQALKADAHRHKQDQRTSKALFAQIKASGYLGGYSRVTDFIREWRATEGKKPHAFVPLKFDLGEAFQFDWSEEGLVVGGIYRRMQVSHMKLCASRAFWLVAYPSQGHEMLFDAHTRSFAALGGVARRGIYDNMKTAVDKVKKGKCRVVNARFAVMCAHYLFDADFCNVASGWEKGVVEKNVQDSRRRIWIEAQTRQWHSFEQLNAWLGERCRALWGEIRHPEYKHFSVLEMLEQERTEMMPMPTPFDGYVESPAKVTSTCLVSVQRNRYSVPCEFAGQRVSTRLYPTRISVVAGDAVVARPSHKVKAEHLQRVEIGRWHRGGYLRAGQSFTWSWHQGDEPTGSIGVLVHGTDSLALQYMVGSADQRRDWSQTIRLAHTACNYGKSRSWFVCPVCQRVSYASQSNDMLDRMWRKQSKIETLLDAHWQRPKGMRLKTYDRLMRVLLTCEERREQEFSAFAARLLGIAGRDKTATNDH